MRSLTRGLVLAIVCFFVFGSATHLHAQAVTLNPASAGFGNLAVGTTSTKPVRLLSVSVSPSSATIGVGQNQQFTATGSYSDGSRKDITGSANWSSSNNKVAVV